MKFKNSEKLFKTAKKIIPYASQTFSKGVKAFSDGATPKYLDRGKGCEVWDVDGNKYIDYCMGAQPLILGYSDDDVNKAVYKQLQKGSTFSLNNKLEIDVAQLIKKYVPCAEGVRFGKNGADATTIAVKLARAITKRDHIAFCGYHGWHDWFISTTDLDEGIPKFNKKLAHAFSYNDIKSLENIFKKYQNKISCVIMEPITVSPPNCLNKDKKNCKINCKNFCKNNFLTKVKELCKRNKTLLIFDEVITGFRYSMGGAQKLFGVYPDLACFAKAISNAIPLSAITGKWKYMKKLEKVFFSFTYGGDCIGLSAAKATITKLHKLNCLDHINKVGEKLKSGLNKIINKYKLSYLMSCDGFPCRSILKINKLNRLPDPLIIKTFIQQELIKNGILWSQYHSISFAHKKKHINATLKSFEVIFKKLKNIIDNKEKLERYLNGKPCQPVFTRVADFLAVAMGQKKITNK